MSYIKKHLSPGETIIAEAHITFKSVIGKLILAGIAFVIAIILLIINSKYLGWLIVSIVSAVIGLYIVLSAIIKVKTTELAFTNKRIIGKTGFIKVRAMESPLSKINNVLIEQGLFGRIFKFGKIVVNTSSADYDEPYAGVDKPDVFRRMVMEQIEINDEEKSKPEH